MDINLFYMITNKTFSLLLSAATALVLNVLPAQADNHLPAWAFGGFERPEGVNPLITPNVSTSFSCPMRGHSVAWECADTFNPAAVEKDGKICILYRAEDDPNAGIGGRTSRIGYAESKDGIHIDYRQTTPVMYPDDSEVSRTYEWKGGCEDPRVVAADVDGKTLYVMTYTSWNNKVPRLAIATSSDLKTWTKHGPALLRAYNGKFKDLACKSGSIVTEVVNGRQVAAKVNVGGKEKYLMYWGEQWVCAATSDDLVNWTPYVDGNKELVYLIEPRDGYFDSMLTECGPPAVKTGDGIILFYNGKNDSGMKADAAYPANTYAAGQILFSNDDPLKPIARLDKPFFRPMTDFEKTGQYAAGTVFIEGLVYHNGKWYLYYGCADSMVGVAVYDPAHRSGIGDPTTLQIPEGIVNAWPANGQGKVRCTIHSYSGAAADSERPFYLNTSYSMPNHKWCDTSEGDSWVVFEFTDVYSIRRLVFRDVQGHESNCGNVPEYTVLTSMDGKQWTEVAHKTGVENEATKDVSFTDTEARYVKLVLKKGTRGDGRKDNAVRIYGVDIYGEMAAQADHAGVVSIGKTLLKGSDAMNERETAANLLDGNHTDKNTKWCFAKGNADTHPYNFAIIDLEDEYMVSGFHLYDCRTLEPDVNVSDYQIYVSDTAPDLGLISVTGDSNTCWELAVDKKGQANVNIKKVTLDNAVKARYVKLVVPHTTPTQNAQTTKLYAFDVLGTSCTSGIGHATAPTLALPALARAGQTLHADLGCQGVFMLYSPDGTLAARQPFNGTLSFSLPMQKGLYVACIRTAQGLHSAKMAIR